MLGEVMRRLWRAAATRPFLCLAWTPSACTSAVCFKGNVLARREGPLPLGDPGELANSLRILREELKFNGQDVFFVICNDDLWIRLVPLPPLGPRKRRQLIEQIVRGEIGSEQSWAYELVFHVQSDYYDAAVLYTISSKLVSVIEAGCEQAGLELRGLFPYVSILRSIVDQELKKKGQPGIVLFCCFLSGMLCQIALEEGYKVLLVRSVRILNQGNASSGGAEEAKASSPMRKLRLSPSSGLGTTIDHLKLGEIVAEIQRSAFFVTSRTGKELKEIHIAGEWSREIAGAVTNAIGKNSVTKVVVDLTDFGPGRWVQFLASKNPLKLRGNFVDIERWFRPVAVFTSTVTLLVVTAFIGLSLAGSSYLRAAAKEMQMNIATLTRQSELLKNGLAQLSIIKEQVKAKEEFVRAVANQSRRVKPAEILSYLGVVTPEPLVLRKFSALLNLKEARWIFELEGRGYYVWEDRRFSYSQLVERVNEMARVLEKSQLGIQELVFSIGGGTGPTSGLALVGGANASLPFNMRFVATESLQ